MSKPNPPSKKKAPTLGLIDQCDLLRLDIKRIGIPTLLEAMEAIEEKYFDSEMSYEYGWDDLCNGLDILQKFIDTFNPNTTKTEIAKQFIAFSEEIPKKVFRKHYRRMVISFYRTDDDACGYSFSKNFLHFFIIMLDLLDELNESFK